MGYADGLNLYAYVGNDPLNLTDPSGLLGKRLSNRYSLNKTAVDFALGLTPLGGLGEAYYAAQAGDYTAAAIAAVQELPVGKVYKIGSNIAGVVRGATKSAGDTLRPGKFAKESIPAHRGRPTAAEQRQVNDLMNKHGCHTCGTKNPGTKCGNAVADHQPPQALSEPKEFFPHCINCARRQGGQVLQEKLRRNR